MRTTPSTTKRRTGMPCPHCQSETIVRSSAQITPLAREARHMCLNDECGHVFATQTEIVRTIAPSRIPDPAIKIRIVNQNLRPAQNRPTNDNQPAPANDDHPATAHQPHMT